ncbi:MAG TPA: alpha-ketoacid dehydrogenase subunit beta [Firmicutes bacterium]|nr:alpha-ketoacid dehydrogenase subunit beta [Bacillota bacterium]HHY99074.1 alpha-ketoacid dehydrogenase subunit beta [Bacillota bacterium]
MREIPYWQALNEALQEEMDRDENVILIGEDIGVYGGAYGVTRDLYAKYGPERVRDAPISEAAIVGGGLGAALTGLRPVVEIMYVDFIGLAMDQIANQAAKIKYMTGGKARVPLVIRTEGGTGRTLGAHHSQSLEAWILHVPGLKLVMPSTPYDAKGLLKSAIRDDNPVVFIEHKMLYRVKGPVPEGEYLIPIGVADVKRQGGDVTMVTYSKMVHVALEAAQKLEEEGIDVEVIDLRSLCPMDMETVIKSVKKTHRVIVLHEAVKTGGVGAEISARIMEAAFDYLDYPVVRLAGADVPIPKSPVLEEIAIPRVRDVVSAVHEMVA